MRLDTFPETVQIRAEGGEAVESVTTAERLGTSQENVRVEANKAEWCVTTVDSKDTFQETVTRRDKQVDLSDVINAMTMVTSPENVQIDF